MTTTGFRVGTCSWKYDAWRGHVYSGSSPVNYLAEYACKYDCVEVDQWFWSLYGPDKVVLPQARVVKDYAASVPDGFRFAIKMPNALTLTHLRPKHKADPPVSNPHFLSLPVLHAFLYYAIGSALSVPVLTAFTCSRLQRQTRVLNRSGLF